MKNLISRVLVLLLLLSNLVVPQSFAADAVVAETSLSTDNSVMGTLYDTGLLVIHGNGIINKAGVSTTPLYTQLGVTVDKITSIRVDEGVVNIPTYIFRQLSKVQTLTVQSYNIAVGANLFIGIDNSTPLTVKFLENVQINEAFKNMTNLKVLEFYGDTNKFETDPAVGCTNLEKVKINNMHDAYLTANNLGTQGVTKYEFNKHLKKLISTVTHPGDLTIFENNNVMKPIANGKVLYTESLGASVTGKMYSNQVGVVSGSGFADSQLVAGVLSNCSIILIEDGITKLNEWFFDMNMSSLIYIDNKTTPITMMPDCFGSPYGSATLDNTMDGTFYVAGDVVIQDSALNIDNITHVILKGDSLTFTGLNNLILPNLKLLEVHTNTTTMSNVSNINTLNSNGDYYLKVLNTSFSTALQAKGFVPKSIPVYTLGTATPTESGTGTPAESGADPGKQSLALGVTAAPTIIRIQISGTIFVEQLSDSTCIASDLTITNLSPAGPIYLKNVELKSNDYTVESYNNDFRNKFLNSKQLALKIADCELKTDKQLEIKDSLSSDILPGVTKINPVNIKIPGRNNVLGGTLSELVITIGVRTM